MLDGIKTAYFVGIKGTGMSALAVNLKQMGISVSGSDSAEAFFTDELLAAHQIPVFSPFSPTNIPSNTDLVIVSTAYTSTHPEYNEAIKRGLTIKTYPEILGLLSQELRSIAVCGSHGKTTTTAALGYIMHTSSYSPIINVGSIVPELIEYQAQDPKLCIFEADEYQNKFQYYFPWGIILTNIDYDHPDFFKDEAEYAAIFKDFVTRLPDSGLLVYCADHAAVRDLADQTHAHRISYGISEQAQYKVIVKEITSQHMIFEISEGNKVLGEFTSPLLGTHNALNLTAAILMANYLDIPLEHINESVQNFHGTKRRLEITKTTEIKGHETIIIDDFAHHPTEIKATLETINAAYPDRKIYTVFQPHTFSRTQALFDQFSQAFKDTNTLILLDIYGSKREATGTITAQDLVEAIKKGDPDKSVFHAHHLDEAASLLKDQVSSPSLILTMGATELWRLKDIL